MAQSSSAASQGPPPLPPGCKGLDDVDIIIPSPGVSAVSRQLLEGCARRSFTHVSQVTQLIEQGANPRAIGALLVRGATGPPYWRWRYSCLSFAIDSPINYPFLRARGADNSQVPVVPPQWSSLQLQRDILSALIDGGADINGGGCELMGVDRPIRVAVGAGNMTAVEVLLARQADVRGIWGPVMELPCVGGAAPPPTREYEAALMSIYRRLIQHDSTLAAERSAAGDSLLHLAATAPSTFSQQFIDQYLTLITSHGADMTARDTIGYTPLHLAAKAGSAILAEWLCRRITADDINRGRPPQPHRTPLAVAAEMLRIVIQQQQQQQHGQGEALGEWHSRRIRQHKTTIRVLLRSGAAPSIARIPTATERDGRHRHLVLAEYAIVLSELSEVVMSAINAALAPQRDHSRLLARLLPLAPHH
ncbi:unnamed protein product, partial [Vitrella brassicaformis CCMP3155]